VDIMNGTYVRQVELMLHLLLTSALGGGE